MGILNCTYPDEEKEETKVKHEDVAYISMIINKKMQAIIEEYLRKKIFSK